jgi:hypothetical protein
MRYPSAHQRADISHVQPILGTLRTEPLPESTFDKDDYPVAYDVVKRDAR